MNIFLLLVGLSIVAVIIVGFLTPKKKKLVLNAPPPGGANDRGFADWCNEKSAVLSYPELKNADLIKTAMSLCNFIAADTKTPFLKTNNTQEWERIRQDTMMAAGFSEVEFATYLLQMYAGFERFGENTQGEIDFVRENIDDATSKMEKFYWNTVMYIGFNPTTPEMMKIYITQSQQIAEGRY